MRYLVLLARYTSVADSAAVPDRQDAAYPGFWDSPDSELKKLAAHGTRTCAIQRGSLSALVAIRQVGIIELIAARHLHSRVTSALLSLTLSIAAHDLPVT